MKREASPEFTGIRTGSCHDADDVLGDIADWGGIPCGFEEFFVTHVANMLANTAIDDEEDLRRFFPDDDRSVFAAETRRCFKRLDDARN